MSGLRTKKSGIPNDKLKEDVFRRVLDVQIEARNEEAMKLSSVMLLIT